MQLLTSGGRLRSVQMRYDERAAQVRHERRRLRALPTIAFAQIDAGAPARLARSAAGRVQQPVSRVDYVVRVETHASRRRGRAS